MSALDEIMNKDLPDMTAAEYAVWYLCAGGDKHHARQAAAELARKDAIEQAAREVCQNWDGVSKAALAAALGQEQG